MCTIYDTGLCWREHEDSPNHSKGWWYGAQCDWSLLALLHVWASWKMQWWRVSMATFWASCLEKVEAYKTCYDFCFRFVTYPINLLSLLITWFYLYSYDFSYALCMVKVPHLIHTNESMQAKFLMVCLSICFLYQCIVLARILLKLIRTWCSQCWLAVYGNTGKGGFVLPFLYLYLFREFFHQMHHYYRLVMVQFQIFIGTDSC